MERALFRQYGPNLLPAGTTPAPNPSQASSCPATMKPETTISLCAARIAVPDPLHLLTPLPMTVETGGHPDLAATRILASSNLLQVQYIDGIVVAAGNPALRRETVSGLTKGFWLNNGDTGAKMDVRQAGLSYRGTEALIFRRDATIGRR